MRFITAWFTCLLLSLLLIPVAFAETSSIQLFMNGKQLIPEVPPQIVKGNTIVPVRIIAEAVGSKVSWDPKQRKVSVNQGSTSIQLFIDKTSATVNGKAYTLEAAPVIIDGNTMLPLRFVVEQLNTEVEWDGLTQSVFMYQKKPQDDSTSGVAVGGEEKPSPNDPAAPPASGEGKTDAGGTGKPGDKTSETPGKVAGNNGKPSESLQTSTSPKDKNQGQAIPVGGTAGGEGSAGAGASAGKGGTAPPIKAGETGIPTPTMPPLINSLYSITLDNEAVIVKTSRTDQLEPKVFRLSNPERLVVDIPGVQLDTALADHMGSLTEGTLPISNGNIAKIRYSLFSKEESIVRIVIDLAQKAQFMLVPGETPGQFALRITPPRSEYLVYIDPGHGAKDSGAVSRHTGRYEKTFVLALGKKVAALLEKEKKIQVRMTRGDDTFLELAERVALANQADADLFVSIHANSADKETIRGTETYYYTDQSVDFAKTMHAALLQGTGFPDRKVKKSAFHVIRNTTMPSVLLEIGFMSNRAEESQMFQEAFQDQVAASIVAGIKTQLNLE
ncbi:N-acetylmuramoyl-L-alanine amidase [Paenibacillus sp. UNCCL117]|uniref:N-acetylmuramoyl-L-alanine amidase family protein n=1 Tax=unclassified Paenibacillus TaxID=185978 RepID=UPI0008820DA5|nr:MULTISPECIES: N-acetylmuramoyl-L-alanine amidase family protein [unclassified Paenibacillus]SDC42220.1 N-acetylmuramoyl-L-alanine amidase [Paenibacillus sp. cl123]SFW13305.1 N-acetylmuramoyl-L-alanine amidase [Paenibacillus sp. UNCCL117]